MNRVWIVLPLLMALVLAGCASQVAAPNAAAPAPVDIGGTQIPQDTQILELTQLSWDLDTLVASAAQLQGVKTLELGCTELSAGQVQALMDAFPQAQVNYTVALLGNQYSQDTTELDMSAMQVASSQELARAVALLPQLQRIDFVNDQGVCVFDLETISHLDAIRQAAPQAKLEVSFQLFGKTVTSQDTRIEYYLVPIGNDGVEQVRAVLPYLSKCTYFLMDGCQVDNQVMAQLRADFPQAGIVWRVWIYTPSYTSQYLLENYSYLTDVELIRTQAVRDFNSKDLRYCSAVKYVDFGHNPFISDFSFLATMPELEVAILALTGCQDLTPLANCPKLEYLELFTSNVTDLSPLASCKELKHLNISNLPGLTDLTPLYGLDKLERVRIVTCEKITPEQIAELQQILPNCTLLTEGANPTEGGWRKDEYGNLVPRYQLLQEQMQYP